MLNEQKLEYILCRLDEIVYESCILRRRVKDESALLLLAINEVSCILVAAGVDQKMA